MPKIVRILLVFLGVSSHRCEKRGSSFPFLTDKRAYINGTFSGPFMMPRYQPILCQNYTTLYVRIRKIDRPRAPLSARIDRHSDRCQIVSVRRELKISCRLIPHTREWAPTCLVNFCVEFGTNALACHDQLGIVQFGGQRLSNVIANLHVGIPLKPEDTIGCSVLSSNRSKPKSR